MYENQGQKFSESLVRFIEGLPVGGGRGSVAAAGEGRTAWLGADLRIVAAPTLYLAHTKHHR